MIGTVIGLALIALALIVAVQSHRDKLR